MKFVCTDLSEVRLLSDRSESQATIFLDLDSLQVGILVVSWVVRYTMRISEAASTSGIGIDIIRYYENLGAVPHISRGRDGRRESSGEDVEWLTLLCSLRETGMSLKRMSEFAHLYWQGDKTLTQRKAVLLGHFTRLELRRAALDR